MSSQGDVESILNSDPNIPNYIQLIPFCSYFTICFFSLDVSEFNQYSNMMISYYMDGQHFSLIVKLHSDLRILTQLQMVGV